MYQLLPRDRDTRRTNHHAKVSKSDMIDLNVFFKYWKSASLSNKYAKALKASVYNWSVPLPTCGWYHWSSWSSVIPVSQFYLHQVRVWWGWWHDERGEKWHRVTSWSSHNQGGAQTANIDTAVMRTCRSLIKIQMKCAYSAILRPALADVTSHHCTMGLRTSVHSESGTCSERALST